MGPTCTIHVPVGPTDTIHSRANPNILGPKIRVVTILPPLRNFVLEIYPANNWKVLTARFKSGLLCHAYLFVSQGWIRALVLLGSRSYGTNQWVSSYPMSHQDRWQLNSGLIRSIWVVENETKSVCIAGLGGVPKSGLAGIRRYIELHQNDPNLAGTRLQTGGDSSIPLHPT